MRSRTLARAITVCLTIAIIGCSSMPNEERQARGGTVIAIPPPSPASAYPSSSSPLPNLRASASAPADAPSAQWKAHCIEAIERGLNEAKAQEKSLASAYVLPTAEDEVSVDNPMGFFLSVRFVRAEARTDDPAGVWQHRAESLNGSYHVMYIKDVGRFSAGVSFDGWPSPIVQPLLPILTNAVDHCLKD